MLELKRSFILVSKNESEVISGQSKPITLASTTRVSDLANMLGVDPVELIKQLMRLGHMITLNDPLEYEIASKICTAYGIEVNSESDQVVDSSIYKRELDSDADSVERPPVVTVLGHVDHGKTTLLDSIRNTKKVDDEAGGITQHIGAYQVEYQDKFITFIDTPGHEAFTEMRARGTKLTDIAILVVAADDGLMPQTIEAISHIKAAGTPLIVAINKMDVPTADPDKVKRQLSEHELLVEDWGGDVIAVNISALKSEGINDLLENIILLAEISELKHNPDSLGSGVVIEAKVDKAMGNIVSVIVQSGHLGISDYVESKDAKGKIRALLDENGERVKTAGVSMPIEILGLDNLPQPGDLLEVKADAKSNRKKSDDVPNLNTQVGITSVQAGNLIIQRNKEDLIYLNLIIKTDVIGTIEAITKSVKSFDSETVKVNIVHAAAGTISPSDVSLAQTTESIICGFNATTETAARTLAKTSNVEIKNYSIIYNFLEFIEDTIGRNRKAEFVDVVEGQAKVQEVFNVSKGRAVAGFIVTDGTISRGADIHVIRNNEEIFVGQISSLKHYKDDVKQVRVGTEGGMVIESFSEMEQGDVLEAHKLKEATA